MTIDKMRHYMGETIFSHWQNVALTGNRQAIERAYSLLDKEMKDGLLVGVQYEAERRFLKHLLG